MKFKDYLPTIDLAIKQKVLLSHPSRNLEVEIWQSDDSWWNLNVYRDYGTKWIFSFHEKSRKLDKLIEAYAGLDVVIKEEVVIKPKRKKNGTTKAT